MTLYELRNLFIDEAQKVKIFDIGGDDCKLIFEGSFDDLPDEYEDVEISSIDNVYGDCDYIGLNIDTLEEW